MDHAHWLQSLSRTGDEFNRLLATDMGWAFPARDEQCGNAEFIFVDNGVLFLYLPVNSIGLIMLNECLNCTTKFYSYDPDTAATVQLSGGFNPNEGRSLYSYLEEIEALGLKDSLNNLEPVWGKATPEQGLTLFVELFMALKRSPDGAAPPLESDPITGIIRVDVKTKTLTATLRDQNQSGTYGSYVVSANGYLIASTLDNMDTSTSVASDSSTVILPTDKVIMANESEVEIVRTTYASMPQDLTNGQTIMTNIQGYPVSYTKLHSNYGLEATIVIIGDAAYFASFSCGKVLFCVITLPLLRVRVGFNLLVILKELFLFI